MHAALREPVPAAALDSGSTVRMIVAMVLASAAMAAPARDSGSSVVEAEAGIKDREPSCPLSRPVSAEALEVLAMWNDSPATERAVAVLSTLPAHYQQRSAYQVNNCLRPAIVGLDSAASSQGAASSDYMRPPQPLVSNRLPVKPRASCDHSCPTASAADAKQVSAVVADACVKQQMSLSLAPSQRQHV